MTLDINFVPQRDFLMKNKNDIYAQVEYEMFDEMQGEFDRQKYP